MSDLLEDVYQKYKKQIYSYFYRSTLNTHTAEELTQETFLKAFKSYPTFKGNSTVKTWLYTIARNTYLNEKKRKSNQLEDQYDPTDVEFLDEMDNYRAVDEQLIIRKILYLMPEHARTLVILRDQNGLTYKEIALILDETEGQIKIGLYRARKKFKELYSKMGRDYDETRM